MKYCRANKLITGEYKNDKREGKGVYSYANADRYEGEFKDDMKNGKGKYFYFDGAIKEGTWENDKYVG